MLQYIFNMTPFRNVTPHNSFKLVLSVEMADVYVNEKGDLYKKKIFLLNLYVYNPWLKINIFLDFSRTDFFRDLELASEPVRGDLLIIKKKKILTIRTFQSQKISIGSDLGPFFVKIFGNNICLRQEIQ